MSTTHPTPEQIEALHQRLCDTPTLAAAQVNGGEL
jgi:hypothetical protein